MTLCFCGRAPRGFAFYRYDLPGWDRPPPVKCCSIEHLNLVAARKGAPVKLDSLETEAVEAASAAAGEYLERIGKTDLATMTAEEFSGFLGHVYRCITRETSRLVEQQDCPVS